MEKEGLKHNYLTVNERNRLMMDGVINVESFDESYVSLNTEDGTVVIEGQGLKIESLSREGGEIEIVGKIIGVYYSEQKKKSSPFSKWFG